MTDNFRSGGTLGLVSPYSSSGKDAPSELEKARAETARVRVEIAAAHESAAQACAKMQQSKRDAKFRLRATAMVMMTAALLRLGWQAAHEPPAVPAAITVQPLAVSSTGMSVSRSDQTGKGASSVDHNTVDHITVDHITVDHSEGAKALERLRGAFLAFPDETNIEVVAEINAKYKGPGLACPLVWEKGIPSLYVGDPEGVAPPSMVNSLNRCSREAEKLRVEKDAAPQ
jgi:hypothetical protein